MVGIYKITNLNNGKIYIGQSIDILTRWQGHKDDSFCSEEKWNKNARHEQTHFHRALRLEGEDAFSWEIIEECSPDELNEKEMYWITYYHSNDSVLGYNMTLGGDGYKCGSGENAPGNKITQIECDLIKEKLKQRWTAEQIISLVPNATPGIISSINYGKSWYDDNEKYPISINNGHRLWSDEEALKIKQDYANGQTIKELADKYKVHIDTISNLVNGKTYTNLPIIERAVNWQRVNKKRPLTNDEVIFYRKLVNQEKKSMLEVFNTYNIPICYAAFRNMVKGITYKDVSI